MSEQRELVIEAGAGHRQYWRDLWQYRELFYFLAWRDLLIRYKQTVIGVAWAVIRPLATMLVLTLLFKKIVKVPDDGIPYPLTAYVGVLAWNFLAASLQDAGNSLVTNSNLISKIYFPRLVVPAATVLTTFVDFLIATALLIVLMAWYQFTPSPYFVFFPAFILLALAAAIGAGLWASALMVRFRDIRFVIPFVVQFGLYLSPIGIKTSLVPEQWRLLYSLNPIVGIVDGFRWSILGRDNPLDLQTLLISIVVSSAILISGLAYFRKTERSFADII
jgi:lipopolysaccharide transport system permease protein